MNSQFNETCHSFISNHLIRFFIYFNDTIGSFYIQLDLTLIYASTDKSESFFNQINHQNEIL